MRLSAAQRDQLIAANEREYAGREPALHFLSPPEARTAQLRRAEFLDRLCGRALISCGGTKLDSHRLSPGCRICAEGHWSCLFVNGSCNCRCFYCPTSQGEIGLPTTNTVDFRTPAEYVAYLQRFGFKGASISGGEPFLTPNRTLAFVRAIKAHFGAAMHVWVYTNGTLVTEDLLGRLRDAGLDEIRFDIGATGYLLDKVRLAVGVIPTVTVEIPAVPEETERLKEQLREMGDIGIDYLNLHQLRLTPYNYEPLSRRNYTYLHGEKVTVLESELSALELLCHAHDHKLKLPINYCSFVYKNRYQGLASRRRNAPFLAKGYETLTASGYLRSLSLLGSAAAIAGRAQVLSAAGVEVSRWSVGSSGTVLQFASDLWPLVESDGLRLLVGYSAVRQLPAVSYRNPFVTVTLGNSKQVVLERYRVGRDYELGGEEVERFARIFLREEPCAPEGENVLLAEMATYERFPEGLQEYF